MLPIRARACYIKQEARDDARSMERIRRMLPFIECEGEPPTLDDAGLERVLTEDLAQTPAHGMNADEIEPIVIFNQFLYDHTPAERERRRQQFPGLFRGGGPAQYGGYGGRDWRRSGDAEYREKTGLVCQPAYALHSFWGCHFRCAYCGLGHIAHVYANVEEWVDHIEQSFEDMPNSPGQRLFQWDNGSDIVCWEPEYGATKLLVELFARQADRHLELYVGKSDHVDFMLDYDHKGHTVCCWSLSTETQTLHAEKRTASMEQRLASARKCQQAGYPVRVRFSPMVPHVGWEGELRHMTRRMLEEIKPEVLTIEPLRFNTYGALQRVFPPGFIDPEFLEAMELLAEDPDPWQRSQFPDHLRVRMYRVVFDEVLRISPKTPVAFCREKRDIWAVFREELAQAGQTPDDYVCNCGPRSAGNDPRLVAAGM